MDSVAVSYTHLDVYKRQLRGPSAKLLLVRADELALALVEQDAADRSAQPFERNRLALAQHRINLEIIVDVYKRQAEWRSKYGTCAGEPER